MAPSFLAYVVKQHGLKFEDVATDALAHILRNSDPARSAFREFLNTKVPNLLPEFFSIETRGYAKGLGIPDLVLEDEMECCRVIVEAKFSAGLTPHQPNSYIARLRDTRPSGMAAMLIFLVPETQLPHYAKTARARCSDEDVNWEGSSTQETFLFVRFISWSKCLAVLRGAVPIGSEYGVFLQELERMCSVAEPDKFEELGEVELASLSAPESQSAQRTRNFLKLADEIARRSFSNTQEQWAKYDNAWGSSWSGLYGKIADIKVWIGMEASAWSERGKSPIWLIIEGSEIPRLEMRVKSLGREVGYFMRNNGAQIAIPILLGRGTRDEVLEQCCEQVEKVRALLAKVV